MNQSFKQTSETTIKQLSNIQTTINQSIKHLTNKLAITLSLQVFIMLSKMAL
jgi:hypothetical protein